MTHVQKRTVEELKWAHRSRLPESHWFEASTMRFFQCRVLPSSVRRIERDGPHAAVWYFVTSERGPIGARRYSLRRMADGTEVETIGEFNALSRAQAMRALGEAVATEVGEGGDA